jgi:uncharacterized transporter YbjL
VLGDRDVFDVDALAVERSENDLPNGGYAAAFPVGRIAKILLTQLILRWAG